jgi:hypothetical protein
MQSIIKILFPLLLTLLMSPLHAQKKGYSAGYVISWEGETG